jgi:DNA repair exonuclease SbcCD nuclease subunit
MSYAIILGDPHVGKGTNIGKTGIGSNLNSRIIDQLNLLDWTLERAIEHAASDIIITGDVFEDPKPHPYLITLFLAWLKKCHQSNIRVHIIRGNHDILRSGFVYTSPLDIVSECDLENINVYKTIDTIFIESTAFTFVPFMDRKSFGSNTNAEALSLLHESFTYELASIPITYKKIMVGHLAIEGSIPVGDEIDDIANELFCSFDMFKGYDSVWMGHVHKPQVMKQKNPYIAHTGSMDISNFGESDHKKHIIIIDCNDGSFSFEELPTRSLKKITISIPKDTVNSTAYVLDEISKLDEMDKAIVKVDVALSTPDLLSINKSEIEKALLEKGVFNITGITESKKLSLIKKDGAVNILNNKMDVPTAIKKWIEISLEVASKDVVMQVMIDIYNELKLDVKK